jgi:aminopeptidase N
MASDRQGSMKLLQGTLDLIVLRTARMNRMKVILFGLMTITLSSRVVVSQGIKSLVTPKHYLLAFTPDLEKKTFEGNESVVVDVFAPASTFTLNAINIAVDSAVVHDGRSTQTATVAVQKDKGTVSISVPNPIEPGEATLEIHYRGSIGDSCCGFYAVTDQGRTYALILAAASQAYPVFEDMTLKATYNVSATVKDAETALSNGAVLDDVKGPQPGTHTITFATSPKMSAYLFTLVVGQLECATGQSDGIPIRICGAPEYRSRENAAVKAAESVLHFYNKYFEIQYPYKKLDMVGLPGIPGAMESTACILANEGSLFKPTTGVSNEWLRNLYLGPIAHEIAHQWFGDLVTMRSQQEFWLNEGMATWMAYKATAALQPQLGIPVEVANRAQMGMVADALPNVAPVRSLDAPDEITYQKSAAVMNMVEHYVGVAPFRVAINAYVKRYAYSNATSEDLWNELAASSGKPIDKIMEGFITKPGIPVVSVRTKCSNGATSVSLTQHRYVLAASNSTPPAQETWSIPVCLRSAGHERCILLDKSNDSLILSGCGAVSANADALGYYRVAYEPEEIKRLSSVAERSMSPAERVNFLNDVWAEVQSQQVPIGDFMSVVSSFRRDASAGVLEVIQKDLTYLDRKAVEANDREEYRSWVARVFAPPVLGPAWAKPTTNEDETARKAAILQIAGVLGGNTRLLDSSKSLIAEKGFETTTKSSLADTAARVVIANEGSNRRLYDKLLLLVNNTKDPQIRSNCLQLLAVFKNQELIGNNLNLLMSGALSVEESRDFRDALFDNPTASSAILSYFTGHWSGVQSKSLVTAGLFRDLSQLCDASSLTMLDTAAKTGTFSGQWQEPFNQARSSVAACVRQRQELSAGLNVWLGSTVDQAKAQ